MRDEVQHFTRGKVSCVAPVNDDERRLARPFVSIDADTSEERTETFRIDTVTSLRISGANSKIRPFLLVDIAMAEKVDHLGRAEQRANRIPILGGGRRETQTRDAGQLA